MTVSVLILRKMKRIHLPICLGHMHLARSVQLFFASISYSLEERLVFRSADDPGAYVIKDGRLDFTFLAPTQFLDPLLQTFGIPMFPNRGLVKFLKLGTLFQISYGTFCDEKNIWKINLAFDQI